MRILCSSAIVVCFSGRTRISLEAFLFDSLEVNVRAGGRD